MQESTSEGYSVDSLKSKESILTNVQEQSHALTKELDSVLAALEQTLQPIRNTTLDKAGPDETAHTYAGSSPAVQSAEALNEKLRTIIKAVKVLTSSIEV